ncbi:MAG: dihydropteroate synthase [Candidatus Bipolaricaulia bacterium]
MVYSPTMNRLAEWMRRRDSVLVMGILNVTPDSFHDGGRYASTEKAVDRALQMEADGADIIDVGGESTRPGADPLPAEEEMRRVLPVIEAVRRRSDIDLSIDTTKADVARDALAAGASVVNDVSALRFDEKMSGTIAEANAFAILMHMKGTPRSMQENPTYDDAVEEVRSFLRDRIRTAVDAGIEPDRILIDPGIGFGKGLSHNLALLQDLGRLVDLGSPVVVGVSRKSFLGKILGLPSDERLEGTIAANAIAIANGADVIRVHDVKEGRRTADVAFRLRKNAA